MRVVNLRARVARRHFISRTSFFPRPDPPSARQARGGGPELWGARSAWTRRRAATRGRSDRAVTNAATSAGSPPTRRPLRALGGNKVHLCQRPGACACETAHTGRPQRVQAAGLSFLPPKHAPRGGQDPHRLLPERGASPAAAVACGLRYPSSRQGGKRARGNSAPGLGAPARPAAFDSPAAPRSPAPLASPCRARLQSGCESRGTFPTPAAARHSGSRAARPQDYKSHQAPRHERRCRRRGPPGACALRPPEPASTTPPGGTEGRQKHPRH